MNYKIDNLQYCNWSREIFEINREAGLDAVFQGVCGIFCVAICGIIVCIPLFMANSGLE